MPGRWETNCDSPNKLTINIRIVIVRLLVGFWLGICELPV